MARSRSPIRALLFDAGHTLLALDYPLFTDQLTARGHRVDAGVVRAAGGGARMRLDVERAGTGGPGRTGEGRYVRYLLDALGIADEAERRAIAEWRRGFNAPIGLCHQADPEAAEVPERRLDSPARPGQAQRRPDRGGLEPTMASGSPPVYDAPAPRLGVLPFSEAVA